VPRTFAGQAEYGQASPVRNFILATASWVLTLLAAFASVDATAKDKFVPPPGCKQRWSELAEFEASLKGERKVPFDGEAKALKPCNNLMPVPTPDLRKIEQGQVAVIVFDITGSGRVTGQQLVAGKGTRWGELSQQHAAHWLFEPLVEDGIGVTRVGVTVAIILERRGQGCGKAKAPPGANYEVRVCWNR
jgi:hypothetical protein